jgi:response regulator of citrate/malate metabolism
MPALFWSLALLLMPEQAEARARVLQDLQETADSIRKQQPSAKEKQQQQPTTKEQRAAEQALPAGLDDATVSAMLQLSLDKRSWVSRCVAEAIRLRVHSIAGEGAGSCLPACMSAQPSPG